MKLFVSKALMLLQLLRVYQWSKNGLVLLPLVFAQQLGDPVSVIRSIIATFAFCLAASATYIINDLMDYEQDQQHPRKSLRPIPSGKISRIGALSIALLLLIAALGTGFGLNSRFLLALVFYLVMTFSYSVFLKKVFIVDVILVALGFVIRAIAGAVAIDVVFSNWLIVCTLFLALFLALGKRRGEIALLEKEARNHREVLHHYSIAFIDQMLVVVAGGALITFTIYTCSPEVVERLGTDKLYMTLPFVVYGLARYLWLIQRNETGDPSLALLKDIPTCVAVVLWGLACILIIYTARL